jgi:CDP-diacylglycerol--glycerol-3-phosphate 3-phosphatidyltransferase
MNSVGALAPFVTELDRLAPSFDVRGEQIQIIRTPAEFYETLKVGSTRYKLRYGTDGD